MGKARPLTFLDSEFYIIYAKDTCGIVGYGASVE